MSNESCLGVEASRLSSKVKIKVGNCASLDLARGHITLQIVTVLEIGVLKPTLLYPHANQEPTHIGNNIQHTIGPSTYM